MAYRMIQVGTGGWGSWWCKHFLPVNVADGLIEVVAAVDIDAAALENAKRFLGLADAQCYTDIKRAFAETRADFCVIAVPPRFHEQVVDLALRYGMHILSEKPIADTLEGSARIAEKVHRAGVKMAVTMSHRFDMDKTTLREELRSGRNGRLDYLACRYSCDLRREGCWGFRHGMDNPLLLEGAVHHLDLLADMAGARAETVFATTWNPPWSDFRNNAQGMIQITCENGVRILYEGADTNAVGLNPWSNEYIRAESEFSTLILDHRELERFVYDPAKSWTPGREGAGEKLPMLRQRKWANAWLVERFVGWLDGGEALETNVEDNLQSVAIVFAAIESNRTGIPVRVQDMLAHARATVLAQTAGEAE